jgi:hypothetical protein
MPKKNDSMEAVDLKHLAAFEEQWVALKGNWQVVDHAAKLAELRGRLGDSAAAYTYFFVPSSKVGYSLVLA